MNSHFIATIAHAANVEDARKLINRVHNEFPDADHHVTAFVIGHGTSQTSHCSDAGEPAGSAGRPSLAVLQGSGLGDVVVVVTRYFGGTKLGVGGLVRAYGNSVKKVIRDVPLARKILVHTISLVYSYPLVERIRKLVSIHSGQILVEDFGKDVTLIVQIPVEDFNGFELDLAKLTSGKVESIIKETGNVMLPFEK